MSLASFTLVEEEDNVLRSNLGFGSDVVTLVTSLAAPPRSPVVPEESLSSCIPPYRRSPFTDVILEPEVAGISSKLRYTR